MAAHMDSSVAAVPMACHVTRAGHFVSPCNRTAIEPRSHSPSSPPPTQCREERHSCRYICHAGDWISYTLDSTTFHKICFPQLPAVSKTRRDATTYTVPRRARECCRVPWCASGSWEVPKHRRPCERRRQWRLPQPVPGHERDHPPLLPPGGPGNQLITLARSTVRSA
jgi:hypothetical protein